jgi:hypothetical protein
MNPKTKQKIHHHCFVIVALRCVACALPPLRSVRFLSTGQRDDLFFFFCFVITRRITFFNQITSHYSIQFNSIQIKSNQIKSNSINSTMKSVIIASLIASAAAFAPVAQQKQKSTLAAFENELGAQQPLGFFDPLGLVTDGDQSKFDNLRYVEIKHGRICQLAFLGQIVTRNGQHLPGAIDKAGHTFESYPNGWAAIQGPDAIPGGGLAQIIAFIAVLELSVMKDVTGTGEFVGDFRNGFIDFGWNKLNPETQLKKRAVELNQGRAAMMGILGLMIHEQIGGTFPIIGEM